MQRATILPTIQDILNSISVIKPTAFFMPEADKGCGRLFNYAEKHGLGTNTSYSAILNGGPVFRGNGLYFDGTDDNGSITDNSNFEIILPTAKEPLNIFGIFELDKTAGASGGYLLTKNLDSAANIQYGLYWDNSSKRMSLNLNGGSRINTANNSWLAGKRGMSNFVWDGATINGYTDKQLAASPTSYSTPLTTRANVRIGCRGNNGVYFKGTLFMLGICRCQQNDFINWINAMKILERYGIAG